METLDEITPYVYAVNMGQLIVEQIISADGFAAAEDGNLEFFEVEGDDGGAEDTTQIDMLKRVDAIVLGANTFRMFQSYWPGVGPDDELVAGPINSLPKHVISSTVTDVSWGDHDPATVEHGEATDIVRDLKSRYAGDVIVWGSLTLTEALFAADLVDVVRLRVVPVLLGAGRPSARGARGPLTFESAESFAAGQVALTYSVRR